MGSPTPEEFAARQRGLVTPETIGECAMSEWEVRRRRLDGRWELLRPGIHAVAGAPRTWEQFVEATVRAAGPDVVVSHGTLCRLLGHDVGQLAAEVIEVTAPLGRLVRLDGVRGHRSGHLDDRDRQTWYGVPGTTAERMVCDLSSRLTETELDRLVDDLQRERRLRLSILAATIQRLGRAPGRSPAVVQRVLAARFPGYEPGDSHFEARVLRVIAAAGLPRPALGVWVTIGDTRFKLDMAYKAQRVYVEADGWEHHGTRSAFDNDRRRLNALVIAGWRPVHLTWRMTDDEIARTVAAAVCSRVS